MPITEVNLTYARHGGRPDCLGDWMKFNKEALHAARPAPLADAPAVVQVVVVVLWDAEAPRVSLAAAAQLRDLHALEGGRGLGVPAVVRLMEVAQAEAVSSVAGQAATDLKRNNCNIGRKFFLK